MRTRLSEALHGLSPEQIENLNTTTDKHILGKRLTIVTAFVCLLAFLTEVFDGGDRSMRMATAILESWLFFLAAYLGINVAQFAAKRVTDKDTKVAVEEAKAKSAPPTVVAKDDSSVQVNASPTTAERQAMPPVTAEHPAPRQRPTGDARVDDERGD